MNTTKRIVTPGELITDQRKKLGDNIYIKENKIYSSVLGILNESDDYISVVALNGPYLPRVGDGVIGIVKNVTQVGYVIDIKTNQDCFFPKSLLTKELTKGQMLFARVKSTNDSVDLENINILPKGNLISVSSVKIPRIIGKNESMLNVLKNNTESNILVGKNGWIWYVSKKPVLLENAINLITTNSQKSNLTNTVEEYLKKSKVDKK
jgi:exosome complex component RRP4